MRIMDFSLAMYAEICKALQPQNVVTVQYYLLNTPIQDESVSSFTCQELPYCQSVYKSSETLRSSQGPLT